jgi:hypothetical protein
MPSPLQTAHAMIHKEWYAEQLALRQAIAAAAHGLRARLNRAAGRTFDFFSDLLEDTVEENWPGSVFMRGRLGLRVEIARPQDIDPHKRPFVALFRPPADEDEKALVEGLAELDRLRVRAMGALEGQKDSLVKRTTSVSQRSRDVLKFIEKPENRVGLKADPYIREAYEVMVRCGADREDCREYRNRFFQRRSEEEGEESHGTDI